MIDQASIIGLKKIIISKRNIKFDTYLLIVRPKTLVFNDFNVRHNSDDLDDVAKF